MADGLKKKQYGLVLKGKKDEKPIIKKAAAIFDEENEVEDKVDVSYSKTSASTIRLQKAAERQHERALAEDPSVFDYDASYDEIQAIKNEKRADQHKKDENRESKYAEMFIKSKLRRDLEKQSREERQQQLERTREGEEFKDKEVFVTGAYKEQMELVQKFREEEAYEARFNQMTSVEHQKAWQAGFGRTLLNDLARTGKVKADNEPEEEASFSDIKKKGVKNIRKRAENRSPSPNIKDEPVEEEPQRKSIYNDDDEEEEKASTKETKKKSIYDDEEGPAFKPPPLKPQKNFEGELRPGLNKVTKKAQTHVERLKERQFTPTPPSSDDEETSKKDKERRKEREEELKREEEKKKEEERKIKLKPKRLSPEEVRAQRLVRLKEIVKQRNGPEEMQAFRERYLQRRDINFVEPPFC